MSRLLLIDLPELQLMLMRFLLGIDLFRLSHVSSLALQVFSQDGFWLPRLPAAKSSVVTSAKWVYMHQYSFVFYGSAVNDKPCNEFKWHGLSHVSNDKSFVSLSWDFRRSLHILDTFSFDLWFSLAPDEFDCVRGGILLELHFLGGRDGQFGSNCRQSAIVDTHGDLYCSIINGEKPTATKLQSERWYHLAVAWDNEYERVYLDGELKTKAQGQISDHWRRQYFWMVGGGCISAESVAKPTADWNAWLGFRGVIDDFRVWDRTLTSDQINELHGQEGVGGVSLEPVYSMKRNNAEDEHADRLCCSRPLEHICRPLESEWKL